MMHDDRYHFLYQSNFTRLQWSTINYTGICIYVFVGRYTSIDSFNLRLLSTPPHNFDPTSASASLLPVAPDRRLPHLCRDVLSRELLDVPHATRVTVRPVLELEVLLQ